MNLQVPILTVACLSMALASCHREAPARGPEEVVREVHQALRSGDMARAHQQVAYEHRLEEVLGEMWRAGSKGERQALVSQVRGMFERTSERLWKEHVGEKALQLKREEQQQESVWIEARVQGDPEDKSAFRWRYRLHRVNGVWAITQREAVILGVPTDTAGFFRIVIRRIAAKIGHDPDLGELVAGLPDWEGRIRKRVIKVPRRSGTKAKRRVESRRRLKGEAANP